MNRNRSIIETYCEVDDEALYNTEVINNDERIEENSFVTNDVLDNDSIENGDVSSKNQSGITNFEVHKSTFCFKMMKKSVKVLGL